MPEIIVTAPRPGQADFADDGDVFNDGEAPAFVTVVAWLEALERDGVVTEFYVVAPDPDNEDAYVGRYETIDGRVYEFESDGGDNYENFLRSAPLPDPTPPVDPNDIAWAPPGDSGYDLF